MQARKSIFMLLIGLIGLLALAPTAGAAAPRCNGEKYLCDEPFDQVILPGTHNAMSSAELDWRIPNQTPPIPGQLEGGIRALLIDTHYGRLQPDGTVRTDDDGKVKTGKRGTYLCHVACEIGASRLAPVLRQIRKFIRANPDNVLLIESEDYIRAKDFNRALRRSGLMRHVYRGGTSPWPTLSQMIRKQRQVVMLSDNFGGRYPWFHEAYDNLLQETPYAFNRPSKITKPRNWRESCQPNRGGTTGSLFLMNHWSPSTPPPEPDYEKSSRVNARQVIVGRALACRDARGRYPSIIAVDQSTAGKDGGVIGATRKLNRMRSKG